MGTAVTHMEHENAESRYVPLSSELLPCYFYIFLQLPHSVFQCGTGIIHLIDYQYVLADKIRHLE